MLRQQTTRRTSIHLDAVAVAGIVLLGRKNGRGAEIFDLRASCLGEHNRDKPGQRPTQDSGRSKMTLFCRPSTVRHRGRIDGSNAKGKPSPNTNDGSSVLPNSLLEAALQEDCERTDVADFISASHH